MDEEIEVLSRSEIKEMISRAKKLRDKAFIAFLYLSGARVGEVCRRIRRRDFWIEGPFLVVQIVTEKIRRTKKGKRKRTSKRNIPIPLDDPLTHVILRYLKEIGPDDVCWPFSQQYARRLVKKLGGPHVYPHLFRHSRITHLIVDYGFNQFDLKRFAGWSDIRPIKFYEHLMWQDYASKLQGLQGEGFKKLRRSVSHV